MAEKGSICIYSSCNLLEDRLLVLHSYLQPYHSYPKNNPFQSARELERKHYRADCELLWEFIVLILWERENPYSLSESIAFFLLFPFHHFHILRGDFPNTPCYLWVIFLEWLMLKIIREATPHIQEVFVAYYGRLMHGLRRKDFDKFGYSWKLKGSSTKGTLGLDGL